MKHYFDPNALRLPLRDRSGFGEIFATPAQRRASECLDTLLDNAERLENDRDRAVKDGKIQGPKKGVPLPMNTLWYRIAAFRREVGMFWGQVKGEEGSGINAFNVDLIQVKCDEMDRRLIAFRKELESANPGGVDPGNKPPPEPPPVIDGKNVLGPLVLGGQTLIAFVALAVVLPKILGSQDK
jgi:hypothetical protein